METSPGNHSTEREKKFLSKSWSNTEKFHYKIFHGNVFIVPSILFSLDTTHIFYTASLRNFYGCIHVVISDFHISTMQKLSGCRTENSDEEWKGIFVIFSERIKWNTNIIKSFKKRHREHKIQFELVMKIEMPRCALSWGRDMEWKHTRARRGENWKWQKCTYFHTCLVFIIIQIGF